MGGFGVAVARVDVTGGRFEGFVAEEDLDSGGVRTRFSEVCGKAVTQTVGARFNTDAEIFSVPFDFHLEVVRTDVFFLVASI